MIRVETLGSMWLIDDVERRYCRFPKHEGPRDRPEWGGPDAGALQDIVWHDFAGDWTIFPDGRLGIQVEKRGGDLWWCVFAPDARLVSGEMPA